MNEKSGVRPACCSVQEGKRTGLYTETSCHMHYLRKRRLGGAGFGRVATGYYPNLAIRV
jgi:hypothetical protein